ncbi:MAG TPA: N-acetylneuraminate synthase family protein [Devosiaceae bacterium]|jgi:N-acetylneuraminate synthase|nr:N-acetylneuraminate synthase family protein [Devosiaceae bacterium]
MSQTIAIAGRSIGPGSPSFLIAEVAQAHDGSLGTAHSYIDAAADAGVDAIKFQTHIAEAESTLDEPFRVRFSPQDDTRYDYWKRMEFTPEQWEGLVRHAAERKIVFLSSAFSVAAVVLLKRLGMPAWKVGSGEVRSRELLDAMAEAGGPVLLSSGMSSFDEIGEAVTRLRNRGAEVGLFQCTSQYPVALDAVGINVIGELRQRFACPVGLSDHSGTVFPTLAAMAAGADMIEAHIVFDRRMYGPDTPASLTVEQFRFLAEARDAFSLLQANPVDKDAVAAASAPMRTIFGKSVATVADLEAGTILTAELLTMKKPGTGIPAKDLEHLVGRRLARRVEARRLLTWEDIDA